MKNKYSLAAILIMITMMASTISACAQDNRHAKLIIDLGFGNVILKNAEDNYLKFIEEDEGDRIDGNMNIYRDELYIENDDEDDDHPDRWLLEIPDSDRFSLEALEEDSVIEEQTEFELRNKYNKSTSVFAEFMKKIIIDKSTVVITGDEGCTFEYQIVQMLPYGNGSKAYFYVDGETIGSIKYEPVKNGFALSGAKGKTRISVFTTKRGKDLGGGNFYFYGRKVRVYKKNGRLIVSPSVKIPECETKIVTSLYLRPANCGKNMFLTWNKVKGAKSYVLYRYDTKKKAYKKVAIRNSNAANYYNIPKADAKERYMYYLRAKKKPDGKGKDVCGKSYPVWAVAKDNVNGNATKVTTNRKMIKGKPGKKVRLKATAKTNTGKRLLSKRIRWYCSNKKIATVGRDTGKVKLKKKGKCEVWAKAHNGVNSRKIKITVK